ncbi:cytochrome P450 [Phanerochaete sordida]|uniref:Cytochrome P450 n=1 Tax=Phanerochaete sordida TaxID=48140 RepID=A0A9P3GRX8_9APHY|nr:cytochrome P450 [Phanerochaete sordida]
MDLVQVLYGCTLLLTTYLAYSYFSKEHRPSPPPGPPGLPLVGHLGMPKDEPWKVYLQWGEEYGSDVVRFNVLGVNIVVTNTLETSADLLEKRSATYSDRPPFGLTMINELSGFAWSIATMRYNSFWRDSRKVLQREYHPNSVQRFRPMVVEASHQFLRNLLEEPEHFYQHIRHFLGRVLLHSAYGIDVRRKDDPVVQVAERGLEAAIAALSPGQFLVDLIPALKYVPAWVPGAGFQRQAKTWHVYADQMLNMPFDLAKKLLNEGRLPDDCAVRSLLMDVVPSASDPRGMEEIVRASLASMYAAGTDTTVSTLQSFFLAMVLFPEAQAQAQEAIDSVCHGRLPDFSDYQALPYIHALLKEVMRWNPVIPLNLAHVSTSDDVYKGYFIPEGTFMLANTWAILHDPDTYADPEKFNPSRFLRTSDSGVLELDPTVRDPDVAAFGFGRRICPGRHLGYEALWLAVASVLSTFNISPLADAEGVEQTPKHENEYGFMIFPKPFVCTIKPRSAQWHETVNATAEPVSL